MIIVTFGIAAVALFALALGLARAAAIPMPKPDGLNYANDLD